MKIELLQIIELIDQLEYALENYERQAAALNDNDKFIIGCWSDAITIYRKESVK